MWVFLILIRSIGQYLFGHPLLHWVSEIVWKNTCQRETLYSGKLWTSGKDYYTWTLKYKLNGAVSVHKCYHYNLQFCRQCILHLFWNSQTYLWCKHVCTAWGTALLPSSNLGDIPDKYKIISISGITQFGNYSFQKKNSIFNPENFGLIKSEDPLIKIFWLINFYLKGNFKCLAFKSIRTGNKYSKTTNFWRVQTITYILTYWANHCMLYEHWQNTLWEVLEVFWPG